MPRAKAIKAKSTSASPASKRQQAIEILIYDEELAVDTFVERALRSYGYKAFATDEYEDFQRYWAKNKSKIALVVSDYPPADNVLSFPIDIIARSKIEDFRGKDHPTDDIVHHQSKVARKTAPEILNDDTKNVLAIIRLQIIERADEVMSASKGGRPSQDYTPRVQSRIRLEPENVEWLKRKGPNYLSRINGILTALREAEEGIDIPTTSNE